MKYAIICDAIGNGYVCLINPSDNILTAYRSNGFTVIIRSK